MGTHDGGGHQFNRERRDSGPTDGSPARSGRVRRLPGANRAAQLGIALLGWTINDLIEHVARRQLEQVGRGRPAHQAARPDAPLPPTKPAAAVAHEIFAAPGGMSATFQAAVGQVPGQVFIGLRTTDVLTHAWDLAPPP